MKHPFEIGQNAITFYPNHLWKRVGYVLFFFLLAFSLGIFYYLHMLDVSIALKMLIATVIIFFPFFYMGSKSLTIDNNTGTLTRRSMFGEKVIGAISDFSGASFVTDASYGRNGGGYYRLTYKERPFAKGIRLHTTLAGKSKQMAAMQSTAMPYLSQLLQQHSTSQPLQTISLSIFKQNGHVYTAKQVKVFNLVLGLAFLAGGVYFLQTFLQQKPADRSWYWAFFFAVGILNLAMWSAQVKIDLAARTIEKSFFFGVYKKTYHLDHFIRFNTLRFLMYGVFHSGTDINMDVAKGSTTQRVTLFHRIQNARKLETLMAELYHIIRQ